MVAQETLVKLGAAVLVAGHVSVTVGRCVAVVMDDGRVAVGTTFGGGAGLLASLSLHHIHFVVLKQDGTGIY